MSAIRSIRVHGGVAFVPLTQSKEAVIDAADVHLVEGVNWYAAKSRNTYYAQRQVKTSQGQTTLLMHRVLMADVCGEVDHKNGDGLDNRRSNLRPATKAQNQINTADRANSTGFKGVHFRAKNNRWVATIRIDGKRKYLGMFETPELAGAAYTEAAKQVHSDFRRAF